MVKIATKKSHEKKREKGGDIFWFFFFSIVAYSYENENAVVWKGG